MISVKECACIPVDWYTYSMNKEYLAFGGSEFTIERYFDKKGRNAALIILNP